MEAANQSTVAASPPLGRRTYLVDRGFQLRYSVTLGVVAALISALFGAMTYLAQVQARASVERFFENAGGRMPDELRLQLAEADFTLVLLTTATVVLMAASLALFGVLVTHRVAGPVHVLSHYISVLARGRYPQMRPLRKHDELKAFFERFSSAVESLRRRDEGEAEQLDDAVKRLAPLATQPDAQAALEGLKALRDRKREATDRVGVTRP